MGSPSDDRARQGRRLCFDLDGTLCTNTFGAYEEAVPFPWAITRVNELAAAGHHILIMTARGFATGIDWDEVTRGQLARWGVRYDELHFGKPNADIYVDDRAVHTESWRVGDIVAIPGGGDELPLPALPDRTAIVEVARTVGGRPWAVAEHARRVLERAANAGLRWLPTADEIEAAVAASVGSATPGEPEDDLLVTIALADGTPAALVDTWQPAPGGGLTVSVRRLSQSAAGLSAFAVEGSTPVAITAATGPARLGAWPLAGDDHRGIADRLGGRLGVVRDGTLVLSPQLVTDGPFDRLLREAADAAGLARRESPLSDGDLAAADEAVVCGLPFAVLPIARLDGRELPTAAGERLLAAVGERLGHDLAAQTSHLVARAGVPAAT